MSELTPFEIEGTLNGQREVLTLILTHLLRNPDEALTKALDERLAPSSQQEDPGAVPQAAFAVEGAQTREIKRILDDAKARVSSGE
ncbi:hypothetical protein JYU29_17205 [Tianweitania sp. BSSL-BM11]|uniref:Uncharacterized protein n=1 Tax=Tianweitania aestuarii TaxID=2814886 RepID=A0ABS5RZE8_9HYPH|nr:hypothetical protein [Tianweitania aestuarii]MBS9722434.1 hypothetical protein [Tianweitania aestuarii]